MSEKIDELKNPKSDLEILEEMHKRLTENNKKTDLMIDRLNKEMDNENLRNR